MQKPFASTPSEWKAASRPNYKVNKDLEYPYSECPFLGEFDLVKIPLTGLVEHIDYWGEGRIDVDAGISGFTDCYNVNHTYQLVSNGDEDTIDRKIPNRIPVVNYVDCRTDSYIKDNSVKIVTLMGAPINSSCASDIARIVKSDEGMVVLYGKDRNVEEVENLNEKLNLIELVCCPGFELPSKLQGLTLFDRHLAFINLTDFSETLYNSITSADYDNAVNMSLELGKAKYRNVVTEVVERLLEGANQKTMTFAYKLWVGGGQDIVYTYFPSEFYHILRSDELKIISNYYNQALKLDSNTDVDNDRVAWGDSKDKYSTRIIWKCFPETDDNNVVFKIKNTEYSMFLKLDVTPDSFGDRKCFGSNNSNEKRHKWSLEPIRYKGNVLFFIINYDYQQGLHLATKPDSIGDRVAWGHNGNVVDNPNYFGWLVEPMHII